MRVYHFALPTKGLFLNTDVHIERVMQHTCLDYTDLIVLLCEHYSELGWDRDLDRIIAERCAARYMRKLAYRPKLIESLLVVLECGQMNINEWLDIAKDHWNIQELSAVVPKRWLSSSALLLELRA